MKTKIQKLIEEQKQKIKMLEAQSEVASKLEHNAHCVVITARIKEILSFIKELQILIS